MKSLLSLIIVVLLSIEINAQNGWQVQLGGIDPYNYNRDIFFINSQKGWILQNDKIKYTTNSGADWIKIPFRTSGENNSRNIFFINADTGWITGTKILKTVNGGLNWTTNNFIINSNSIFFLNAQTGWLCGTGGQLVKSTDGGLNWAVTGTGISENLNDVMFLNGQTGFLAADWGKIFRTTNGGINWEVLL